MGDLGAKGKRRYGEELRIDRNATHTDPLACVETALEFGEEASVALQLVHFEQRVHTPIRDL